MTKSLSLVLENHNLQAGDDAEQHAALVRLLGHLRPLVRALDRPVEVVLTHVDRIDARAAELDAALGQPLVHVSVPRTASYYDAKNLGFDASSGQIVVFGDSDCWPAEGWLEGLVAAIEGGAGVAAGRTRYQGSTLGRAVSLLDFLYVLGERDGVVTTRNFYANNVAFRREVFAAHRYPEGPFFRGHCQVLGLELAAARIDIAFVDEAVTVHRFPDRLAELVELRLRRGRDLAQLAPRIAAHAQLPISGKAGTWLTWLGRQAIAHRDLSQRTHGLDRVRVETVSLLVAAVDACGMVQAGVADDRALGYVTDRDGLATPAPSPRRALTALPWVA